MHASMIRSYVTYITTLGNCNHHVSYWWTTKRKSTSGSWNHSTWIYMKWYNDWDMKIAGYIYWKSIVRDVNGRSIMIGWLIPPHNTSPLASLPTQTPRVLVDIRQILMETHSVQTSTDGGPQAFFNSMLQQHYVLFSKEANTHPGARPFGLFYEWSWLKLHSRLFLWINVHTVAWLYIYIYCRTGLESGWWNNNEHSSVVHT